MQSLHEVINPQSEHQKMVIVTGPFSTGKSSFIASLTGQFPVEIDANIYMGANYVPFDLGVFAFGTDQRLFLLELPGVVIIDRLVTALSGFIIGIILIFDSSRPEMFREAASTGGSIRHYMSGEPNIPFVIAANPFRYLDEQWHLDDLRIGLRLAESDQLFVCDATQYRSTADIMLSLAALLPDTDFVRGLRATLQDEQIS